MTVCNRDIDRPLSRDRMDAWIAAGAAVAAAAARAGRIAAGLAVGPARPDRHGLGRPSAAESFGLDGVVPVDPDGRRRAA